MKAFIPISIFILSILSGPDLNRAQQCMPTPAGLVAWYSGDGTANDFTGNNNGTLQNGATFAAGKVGLAFCLNGNGQFVSLPANVIPYPGTQPLSVDAWFQTTVGGVILGRQGSVSPPTPPPGSWVPAIYVGTDGILRVSIFWNGSIAPLSSTATVNDGVFHHVAVTWDGSTETAYLDGVSFGSQSYTQVVDAPGYQYQIGTGFTAAWPAGDGGYFYFQGLIDEVEFFNRALSQAEVQAIFNSGSAGTCKN